MNPEISGKCPGDTLLGLVMLCHAVVAVCNADKAYQNALIGLVTTLYFRVYTYPPLSMTQPTFCPCMRVLTVQDSLLASGRFRFVHTYILCSGVKETVHLKMAKLLPRRHFTFLNIF